MNNWEITAIVGTLLFGTFSYTYIWYQKLNSKDMIPIYIQVFGFWIAIICCILFFHNLHPILPKLGLAGVLISFLGGIFHTKNLNKKNK